MDFDLSKENIQPLRGGRNAAQLAMALQAQTNHESQHELIQQKEMFENAIRVYDGDDPLDNWYRYISWMEQSYPKHGHEGNLRLLLQDCLSKFEQDHRYMNDQRFCKLWIKFIDYHQNPLDLYHMLYAKGIGRGCADIYKAWAYYYEVAGDFKGADVVFIRGERELAQPLDELILAHQNMVYAAGQQVIRGVDEARLHEQRQALTCLKSFQHGRVSSIRVPSSSGAGNIGARVDSGSNVAIPVYEVAEENSAGAEAAAPVSVISAAKLDEGCKENLLKPGPWTTVTNCRPFVSHRFPPITIHEDGDFDIHQRGLIKGDNFFPVTHEDHSNFRANLSYPEPPNPNMIPKYPKALVYAQEAEGIEYSIEEVKARQYMQVRRDSANGSGAFVPYCETEQAIQSILEESQVGQGHIENMRGSSHKRPFQVHEDTQNPHQPVVQHQVDFMGQNQQQYNEPANPFGLAHQGASRLVFPNQNQENHIQLPLHLHESKENLQPQNHAHLLLSPNRQGELQFLTVDAVWDTSENSRTNALYEEANAMQGHIRGSAMRTPIKILSDDELAETGSRGGLDVAAAAQPADGALINLDEDTNSSYGGATTPSHGNFDVSSTQMFNFNLTAMKVSTPMQQRLNNSINRADVEDTRKELFAEQKVLSTIMEETNNYGTSSSGSSMAQNSRKTNLTSDHSSYSSNLAQNLKANAALRSSLLGEYMDCQSQDSSPIAELPPPIPPAVKPTHITPLTAAPSDPFQGSLIKMLLERINFPGQHTYGYRRMLVVPKLNVKKEAAVIGDNRYIVEKIVGKGTYGSVFKAIDCNTREIVALKQQRPPNKWEFYICRELQARLAGHPLRDKFMDVSIGFFNEQASILVSEFSPNGSLLDIANVIKQKSGRTMKETLCIYFCIEMLEIIDTMHRVKIIHADVKPDNFLVHLVDNNVHLQLIDFGCSIDMAMFPPDTTFNRRVRTEDFICCEMHDGRPWSYHTDLFCVAATAHVLLFDKYIQMQTKDGHWSITQRFSRYMRVDCWNMFFSSLLNQQTGPAKVEPLMSMFRNVLEMSIDDYNTEMRFLVNLLKGR